MEVSFGSCVEILSPFISKLNETTSYLGITI